MSNLSENLLATARQRAETAPMAYAGAVTPVEAHALLQAEPQALIIDVRTAAERDWIGRVDVADAQQAAIEWNLYPGSTPNPVFLEQLRKIARPEQVLLFLCRSGVRSRHAATLASANGFANCFDILEGFEGDRDAAGHRKTVGGWCAAGLPWIGA